ncbi:MAG: hypothetical protein A3A58_02810 [Candidatus Blackburnbacteria bacterium RIFCSPLOWO2_01_FULL_41_27]|uniref:Aspartyl/glutamyl-tRNA(Asn/Gln) amidotransferase subunit B n=1 Tax=Candidatus Blackburnbacteria bacterium RIFCSPLOWO2_01_FULL_41_27 TaxID=1797520 RepID=A0A1G1VGW4_9BACT|nr:MAG: hypothetical protein A3A58_02810 [Candidatus Blackburnbacteria bacterium RIFCSPLOWO2_01_FULL_41_27]
MKYTPVIGLEIHVELNTKTKMFCSCSADYFGKEPNTHTCPVCLGLPGALPFANKEALEKCLMIGLALNCSVSKNSFFERKNYFYPDLPKGYQISQYRNPLCIGGSLGIHLRGVGLIRINRVHMEEDTGKLAHLGGVTQIDFNRSGVPLVEMVTEPDFETVDEVVEFAKTFQQIVRDLGASNADMERGDLRLEANVSLRKEGQVGLPDYRIELKNINSFRFMQHALEYEIVRQQKLLEQGVPLFKETRGWSEEKKESYLQRSKEDAHDYRYFPEPDIPEISFSDSDIEKIKAKTPELFSSKSKRLETEYGLTSETAKTLVKQGMARYFEEAVKEGEGLDPKAIANAIVNKRLSTELSPLEFTGKFRESTKGQEISPEELEIVVLSVIKHNEKAVGDYKNGKESVIQFLVGEVMRETKGKAKAGSVMDMFLKKLND